MSFSVALLLGLTALLLVILLSPLHLRGCSHPQWVVSFGYHWCDMIYRPASHRPFHLRLLGFLSLPLPVKRDTKYEFSSERSIDRGKLSSLFSGNATKGDTGLSPKVAWDLLGRAFRALGGLLRCARIKRINIAGTIATPDPMLTGVLYGAVLHCGLLLPSPHFQVALFPDFTARRCDIRGEWDIALTPWRLIGVLITEMKGMRWKSLKALLKRGE